MLALLSSSEKLVGALVIVPLVVANAIVVPDVSRLPLRSPIVNEKVVGVGVNGVPLTHRAGLIAAGRPAIRAPLVDRTIVMLARTFSVPGTPPSFLRMPTNAPDGPS